MNPVLHEGVRYAQHAWLMGVVTIVFIVAFLGWTWWALKRSNKARFEAAARMPLADGDDNA